MSVRYTREALDDLNQISSYLAKHNPAVAAALLEAVEAVVARLDRFPMSAQATEMPGVRAAPAGASLSVYHLLYRGSRGHYHPLCSPCSPIKAVGK